MQSEHAPVLRFNVAAFVLCALSMIAFGRTLQERAERHADEQAAEALRQREIAQDQLRIYDQRIQELIELHAKLDAQLAAVQQGWGCTLGSHSSDGEIRRAREKLEELREEQIDARERLDVMRCREHADCTLYSPVY